MITEADILYEDNHILIVNKPPCIPTQSDDSGDPSLDSLVKDFIKQKYNKPGDVYVGLIHRIDRPVSGIVLFAKTSKAAARLSDNFVTRDIHKTYYAIVEKMPPATEGTLTDYLWKEKKENRSYCFNREKPGSKWAQLHYKLIAQTDKLFLLEINPVTGRSHQIRAQLSNIHCPIVGDAKYGSKLPLRDRDICLLAAKITFSHPVKKEPMTMHSLIPKNKFWDRFDLKAQFEK